jgi:hypothetical protein
MHLRLLRSDTDRRLDHLIVAGGDTDSFAESGLL